MLADRFSAWRRTMFRQFRSFPNLRVLGRAALPLKIRKLRRVVEDRKCGILAAIARDGRDPQSTARSRLPGATAAVFEP